MTKREGNILIIEREKPQQCDGCGTIAELRPYGKNGACICVDCGMKDWEETKKNALAFLFGEEKK